MAWPEEGPVAISFRGAAPLPFGSPMPGLSLGGLPPKISNGVFDRWVKSVYPHRGFFLLLFCGEGG